MRLLRVGVVLAAGLVPAGVAQAQIPSFDAGSTRPAFTERGTVITTSTARDGDLRCIGVRSGASMCAQPSRRSSATLIGHPVFQENGRPLIGPLVIAGLAGVDAVRVRVGWDGGSRTIRPRRFGAFGVVLPSIVEQGSARISIRYRDGDVDSANYGLKRKTLTYREGSSRVDLRLKDPIDGHALGLLTWKTEQGQACLFLGDLVSGRVGGLRGSWFSAYPVSAGGSCSQVDTSPEPLAIHLTTEGTERSWVAGFARRDVAAVEVKVGDGPFERTRLSTRRAFVHAFRGRQAVTVAAILRGGQRVERALSPPDLPPAPVTPPPR